MSGRFVFWWVPILLLFSCRHHGPPLGVEIPYHDEFITPGYLLFEMTRGHFDWQNLFQHNDALLVQKLHLVVTGICL